MTKAQAKKIAMFTIRWGIAVFGIYYVLSNISLDDRILVLGRNNWPVSEKLVQPASDSDPAFQLHTGPLTRDKVLVKAEPATVHLKGRGDQKFDVLAQQCQANPDRTTWPLVLCPHRNLWQRYWNLQKGQALINIPPTDLVETLKPPAVPNPVVEPGVMRVLHEAQSNIALLLAAIFVFPLTFLITAYRWHELLKALDIHLTYARTFTLNMVGAFYNTFMPGSTGGDVLKAYYVSKQTHHRTRSVMSVVVDRIIGLLALIIVGGVAAATQWSLPECRKIAMACGAIIAAVILGLLVFYTPFLRRLTGFDFIVGKLPMQKQIRNAIGVMEIYRQRAGLVMWTLVVSFPVHATVVVSAMLACTAFNLPIHWTYYWVVVPVVVLAGAIPISPQGAGVMEAFAFLLTRNHGCTWVQAFALTMSIRMVQIVWNLVGGLMVLRGGYHAPSAAEQQAQGSAEEAI